MLLLNYFTLDTMFYFNLLLPPPSTCLWICYWSHHLRNLLEHYILSAPVQSFYIGLPATYSAIFLSASSRTLLLSKSLLPPTPCPQRTTHILLRCPSLLSLPQYVLGFCDKNPVALPSSCPSLPIFSSNTGSPHGLLPYTSSLGL